MRLAPLFLVLFLWLWLLLATAAWAIAAVWVRRGPRLGSFVVAAAAGLAGGFVFGRLGPGAASAFC
ncbi:MAG TPA: hypothetical protein VND24_06145 [Steroidobacteraceae bacterium]|nr:hypothetical protein [Steroidobacteraceae bacterium]